MDDDEYVLLSQMIEIFSFEFVVFDGTGDLDDVGINDSFFLSAF